MLAGSDCSLRQGPGQLREQSLPGDSSIDSLSTTCNLGVVGQDCQYPHPVAGRRTFLHVRNGDPTLSGSYRECPGCDECLDPRTLRKACVVIPSGTPTCPPCEQLCSQDQGPRTKALGAEVASSLCPGSSRLQAMVPPKETDLSFGPTVLTPEPLTDPPDMKSKPQRALPATTVGPPDDFLPPETNALIRELTAMSREKRFIEIQRMSTERRTKIQEFLEKPYMEGVRFGKDLTPTQRGMAETLLYIFDHVFARPGEVKTLHGVTFSLKTSVGDPVQTPLRRIGKLRDVEAEHVWKMMAEKVIRRSKSPWSSGVCLTPERKPDGTLKYRFCISYVKLNAMTPKDAFVNPPCEEGLELLGGNKYFTTLDMKSAYWTIPMEDDGSIEKTAFITSEGLFEFLRMPFGLKNAGAAYCRYAARVFAGLRWQNLLSYVDDQLIFSMTFEDHIDHLFDALCRISRANMSVGASKCAIGMAEVAYLGYVVGRDGLRPDPKRTSAITKIRWPNTTPRWQSFLGIANTYRKFIKHHARIVKPIQDLIKECSARKGRLPRTREDASEAVRNAFDTIIERITNDPILAHPDFDKPFTIETDGATEGLGAVLSQEKETKIIMFCSRSLKPAEKNYTSYEKECLALVWATDVLRPYLLGAHFNVITDNVAVSVVFAEKKKNQHRMIPWKMKLQQYDFTIFQRPRSKLVVPDGLAKAATHPPGFYGEPDLVLTVDKDTDSQAVGIALSHFTKEQKEDPQCKAIIERLSKGHVVSTRQFLLNDGILYRQADKKWMSPRIVVPRTLRMYILREFHGSGLAGHSGRNRTLKMIGEYFYWKGMGTDVATFIASCVKCRERKRPKPNRQGEVGQIIVGEVFDTLAMDIVTNLPEDEGYKHILSVIDVFTRYAWAFPLKTREATEVADALAKNILHEHGAFRTLRTDNEKSFLSTMMTRLLYKWSIAHLTTVPYHSESNGHVERLHRFLEEQLTILATSREKWTDHLKATMFAYNVGVHTSTGYSPYFLWHGRRPRLPIECILNCPGNAPADTPERHVEKLLNTLANAYRTARVEQQKAAERRRQIQAGNRKPTVFNKDDTVMYHESERGTVAKHLPKKLAKNASGPHRVLRRIDSNRYVIHHRGRNCEVIVSVKDISKYHPFCKYEDEEKVETKLQVGDLAVIPVKATEDYHPFYVARVTGIARKVTVQWFGNHDNVFLGEHLPEWNDGNAGYFSEFAEAPTHKPITNKDTGPTLVPSQITIFGFRLTKDHRLTPETIALISNEPMIQWKLR